MAITDAERHRLHTKLEQAIGEEDAAVLMEHLPPSGWSDVVRLKDLEQLEARIDLRFEALEHKLTAAFERGLREQNNRFMLLMGAMLSVLVTVQAVFG
jgi:hypothetical protein